MNILSLNDFQKKKPKLRFVRKALFRLRLLIQDLTKALADKVKTSTRNVMFVQLVEIYLVCPHGHRLLIACHILLFFFWY